MTARLQHGANYLPLTTFDGSGDGVHPSILDFGTGILKSGHTTWAGHRYWMVNTPFPGAVATHEYPCVYYSDNGLTWTEAPITSVRGTYESPVSGSGNPIVHNGFFAPFDTRNYCPDPEVTYDPSTDCIDVNFMFLLGSNNFVGGNNGNYRTSINTSLVCSVPVKITAPPTLFLRHPATGAYYGWSTRNVDVVEGGTTHKTRVLDRRESTDGGLTWTRTNISTTLFPWHKLCDMTHAHYNLFMHPDLNTVDFILTTYDAPTYTMLKNAFYYARTYLSNPEEWEFPLGTDRVLEPSLNSSNWAYGFQYKPSFTVEGDKLRLWYSLRQGTQQYPNRLGYAEGIVPELELVDNTGDLDIIFDEITEDGDLDIIFDEIIPSSSMTLPAEITERVTATISASPRTVTTVIPSTRYTTTIR